MQITLGTQYNMGILYRNTNTTGKKIKQNLLMAFKHDKGGL